MPKCTKIFHCLCGVKKIDTSATVWREAHTFPDEITTGRDLGWAMLKYLFIILGLLAKGVCSELIATLTIVVYRMVVQNNGSLIK